MASRTEGNLAKLTDEQLAYSIQTFQRSLRKAQATLEGRKKYLQGYSKDDVKRIKANAKRYDKLNHKIYKIRESLENNANDLSPLERAKKISELKEAEEAREPVEREYREYGRPYFDTVGGVAANKEDIKITKKLLAEYRREVAKRQKKSGESSSLNFDLGAFSVPDFSNAGDNSNFNEPSNADSSYTPPRYSYKSSSSGAYEQYVSGSSDNIKNAAHVAHAMTNKTSEEQADAYRILEEEGAAQKLSFMQTHYSPQVRERRKNLKSRRRQLNAGVKAYEKAVRTDDWSAFEPKYESQQEYDDAYNQKLKEYNEKKTEYRDVSKRLKDWEDEYAQAPARQRLNPFSKLYQRGNDLRNEQYQVWQELQHTQKEGLALEKEKPTLFKSDDWQGKLKEQYDDQVGELKEIDEELEKLKSGVVEFSTQVERSSAFMELINKTLEEIGQAVDKNGVVDENFKFSPEVRSFIESDAVKNNAFGVGGENTSFPNPNPKTERQNADDVVRDSNNVSESSEISNAGHNTNETRETSFSSDTTRGQKNDLDEQLEDVSEYVQKLENLIKQREERLATAQGFQEGVDDDAMRSIAQKLIEGEATDRKDTSAILDKVSGSDGFGMGTVPQTGASGAYSIHNLLNPNSANFRKDNPDALPKEIKTYIAYLKKAIEEAKEAKERLLRNESAEKVFEGGANWVSLPLFSRTDESSPDSRNHGFAPNKVGAGSQDNKSPTLDSFDSSDDNYFGENPNDEKTSEDNGMATESDPDVRWRKTSFFERINPFSDFNKTKRKINKELKKKENELGETIRQKREGDETAPQRYDDIVAEMEELLNYQEKLREGYVENASDNKTSKEGKPASSDDTPIDQSRDPEPSPAPNGNSSDGQEFPPLTPPWDDEGKDSAGRTWEAQDKENWRFEQERNRGNKKYVSEYLRKLYNSRYEGKSAQIRKARTEFVRQMVEAPGASMEYIIEQARKANPTIKGSLTPSQYHNAREFLTAKGVITSEMDDLAGQKVVDANLRAKEMQGWSDDKKIAEYDRMVSEGKIEDVKGGKASAFEKINPFSTYNTKKRKSRIEKTKYEIELQQIQNDLASGSLSPPDAAAKSQKVQENLDRINKQLDLLEKGYAEWVADVDKLNLVNESIDKTIRETEAAIKNGAGDSKASFSQDTQEIINAGGSKESIVVEGGKKRRKSKREKENFEQVIDDALSDTPEVQKAYRSQKKKGEARKAKWGARTADFASQVGRVIGPKTAVGFAKAGAALGSAAATVAGPFIAVAGAVMVAVKVFKMLTNAAEEAAAKMKEYAKYSSTLFVETLRSRGREYRRNVRFAQGTQKSGADLIEAQDDFKDAAQPLSQAWTNLKNIFLTKFLKFITGILNFINNIGSLFSETLSLFKKIPGADIIIDVVKLMVKLASPLVVAGKALGAGFKFLNEKLESAAGFIKAIRLNFSRESLIDEERKEEEKKTEAKRDGVRADNYDETKGDVTAYKADNSGLTEGEKEERQQRHKDLAEEFKVNRGGGKKRKWIGDAAANLAGFMTFGASQYIGITGDNINKGFGVGLNGATVRDSAELMHDLGNIQKASDDLNAQKYTSQEEVKKANADKGAKGIVDANAGIINGRAATKEAQENLIAIGLDNGEKVKKEGESLRIRGELVQEYKETGDISDESLKKWAADQGKATAIGVNNSSFLRKKKKSQLIKEFNEDEANAEAALVYANIGKKAEDRYQGELKTVTQEQMQGADLKAVVAGLEGTIAATQEGNDRLAELVVSNNQIASNTEKEEEKGGDDPIFKMLSKLVDQGKKIEAPQAFVEAQKDSQYGRFAGQKRTQTNWGMK